MGHPDEITVSMGSVLINMLCNPLFMMAYVVFGIAILFGVYYYIIFIDKRLPLWAKRLPGRIAYYEDIAFCFVLERIFGFERMKTEEKE